VRVLNIVIEKKTTGNVGSNGETEFHHVMMDMIPDATGASVNLEYATPVQLQYNVDLSATHVEEYDDLMVAVLVQNQSSKEMLQSDYGIQDTTYSEEARLDMIYIDGVPLEGFDPDIFEYDVVLPEGTVFEPYMEVSTMNEYAMALVNPAFQLPGTATIDIYSEDLFNSKRYLVNYTVYTGIDQETLPMVQVFPNPANDILSIYGLKDATVRLFSVNGKEMLSFTRFSGNSIDVSSLPAGIYIMNITTPEGLVARKKIVVF
jgi:hypothetical protein